MQMNRDRILAAASKAGERHGAALARAVFGWPGFLAVAVIAATIVWWL